MHQFQSTLPMRGATTGYRPANIWLSYFNPRSPCGERPFCFQIIKYPFLFQSTLPMRGATQSNAIKISPPSFQSTLPMRGATCCPVRRSYIFPRISIHAPHAGSDVSLALALLADVISIHAPHAGSDCWRVLESPADGHFNPRSPCGERHP